MSKSAELKDVASSVQGVIQGVTPLLCVKNGVVIAQLPGGELPIYYWRGEPVILGSHFGRVADLTTISGVRISLRSALGKNKKGGALCPYFGALSSEASSEGTVYNAPEFLKSNPGYPSPGNSQIFVLRHLKQVIGEFGSKRATPKVMGVLVLLMSGVDFPKSKLSLEELWDGRPKRAARKSATPAVIPLSMRAARVSRVAPTIKAVEIPAAKVVEIQDAEVVPKANLTLVPKVIPTTLQDVLRGLNSYAAQQDVLVRRLREEVMESRAALEASKSVEVPFLEQLNGIFEMIRGAAVIGVSSVKRTSPKVLGLLKYEFKDQNKKLYSMGLPVFPTMKAYREAGTARWFLGAEGPVFEVLSRDLLSECGCRLMSDDGDRLAIYKASLAALCTIKGNEELLARVRAIAKVKLTRSKTFELAGLLMHGDLKVV